MGYELQIAKFKFKLTSSQLVFPYLNLWARAFQFDKLNSHSLHFEASDYNHIKSMSEVRDPKFKNWAGNSCILGQLGYTNYMGKRVKEILDPSTKYCV